MLGAIWLKNREGSTVVCEISISLSRVKLKGASVRLLFPVRACQLSTLNSQLSSLSTFFS